MKRMTRKTALAQFLNVKSGDLKVDPQDSRTFHYGNQEYLVLTDKQANFTTKERIIESLCYFRAPFLAKFLPLSVEAIQKLQELCEDANDAFIQLLKNKLNSLVKEAIQSDGRGHFISGYDSEENESGNWFIYRTN